MFWKWKKNCSLGISPTLLNWIISRRGRVIFLLYHRKEIVKNKFNAYKKIYYFLKNMVAIPCGCNSTYTTKNTYLNLSAKKISHTKRISFLKYVFYCLFRNYSDAKIYIHTTLLNLNELWLAVGGFLFYWSPWILNVRYVWKYIIIY